MRLTQQEPGGTPRLQPPASPIQTPARGPSRLRLRVRLMEPGVKPYGWELYDEEADRPLRQSTERFRTSRQAWEAGQARLAPGSSNRDGVAGAGTPPRT